MKRLVLGFALVAAAGCSKKEAQAPQKVACSGNGCAEFDQKWAALEKTADPAFIEKGGAGLLGEVRRSVDPVGDAAPFAKEVKGELPDPEVVKVIRANLSSVKACYAIEEKNGTVGSGKAILTLSIKESGSVDGVTIDAPAFQQSHLPACLSEHAKSWTFPKFTQGPKSFSYPLVFVGG